MLPNKPNQPYRVELLFQNESRWVDLFVQDGDDALSAAETIAGGLRAPAFRIFDPDGSQMALGIAQC
jgi:hypothetical protein